jgi:hypothetical protein
MLLAAMLVNAANSTFEGAEKAFDANQKKGRPDRSGRPLFLARS